MISRYPTAWSAFACAAMLLLALLLPQQAQAFWGPAGRPLAVCVSAAHTDARTAFAHPERFDCHTPQTSLPAGDYWVLSAPLTGIDTAHPPAVRFASLWQRDATLYAQYRDGAVATMRLDGHALTRHLRMGAIIEQPLPTRGVAVARLLWHVEGAANIRGLVGGPTLVTEHESALADLRLGALYAGFAGLCVALLVYNLALWAALRHSFQLAYCGMVAALLVYAFSASGAMAWVFPDLANNDRMRVNYMMLAVAGATALLFARTFFEPRVFGRWLRPATTATIVALIGSGALFALLAPWHVLLLDRLVSLAFLAMLATTATILWRAWRRRSNYLWAFAFAWGVPFVLAALRLANTFHLVGWRFWIDNSTLFAMAVEAMLSSVGIAYRMRLIAAERDEARAQEIAARLLADTDPLTGMLNRRAFLRDAIGREGEQMLLLADIDHFKRVNDTIGHDGGDEVLRSIARAMQGGLPAGALAARIGGEEFAILAPAGTILDPGEILERIRAARMPFDLAVTASIGACTGPVGAEADWKALYRGADRALFAAKSAGRDRVRRAGTLAAVA